MSPALAGGFFTTEPPGQSLYRNFDLLLCFITHKVATVIMLGIVWAYQAEYPKRHMVMAYSFLMHLLAANHGTFIRDLINLRTLVGRCSFQGHINLPRVMLLKDHSEHTL